MGNRQWAQITDSRLWAKGKGLWAMLEGLLPHHASCLFTIGNRLLAHCLSPMGTNYWQRAKGKAWRASCLYLFAEVDLFPDINDGDLLRRCDYDGSIHIWGLQELRDGNVFIWCSAARVHSEWNNGNDNRYSDNHPHWRPSEIARWKCAHLIFCRIPPQWLGQRQW